MDAAQIHLLVSLALLLSFTYPALLNAVYISFHIILTVEWVNEEAILQVVKVFDKPWLQHMTLSVVELTFTMHHSHFPSADVGVSDLLLGDLCGNTFRPNELSIAVKHAKVEIAFVLTTVGVDKVTIAMPCAVTPAARVFRNLVGLYLNSVSVSHCHQLGHEIFTD